MLESCRLRWFLLIISHRMVNVFKIVFLRLQKLGKEGYVSEKFIAYLKDKEKVTFPWSMIDRITPNPSENVKEDLLMMGLEDLDIIHTKTYQYCCFH